MKASTQPRQTGHGTGVVSDDSMSESDSDYVDVHDADALDSDDDHDDDNDNLRADAVVDGDDNDHDPALSWERKAHNSTGSHALPAGAAAGGAAMPPPIPTALPSPTAGGSGSRPASTASPRSSFSTSMEKLTPRPPQRQQPKRSVKGPVHPYSAAESFSIRTPPSDKRRTSKNRTADNSDAPDIQSMGDDGSHAAPGGQHLKVEDCREVVEKARLIRDIYDRCGSHRSNALPVGLFAKCEATLREIDSKVVTVGVCGHRGNGKTQYVNRQVVPVSVLGAEQWGKLPLPSGLRGVSVTKVPTLLRYSDTPYVQVGLADPPQRMSWWDDPTLTEQRRRSAEAATADGQSMRKLPDSDRRQWVDLMCMHYFCVHLEQLLSQKRVALHRVENIEIGYTWLTGHNIALLDTPGWTGADVDELKQREQLAQCDAFVIVNPRVAAKEELSMLLKYGGMVSCTNAFLLSVFLEDGGITHSSSSSSSCNSASASTSSSALGQRGAPMSGGSTSGSYTATGKAADNNDLLPLQSERDAAASRLSLVTEEFVKAVQLMYNDGTLVPNEVNLDGRSQLFNAILNNAILFPVVASTPSDMQRSYQKALQLLYFRRTNQLFVDLLKQTSRFIFVANQTSRHLRREDQKPIQNRVTERLGSRIRVLQQRCDSRRQTVRTTFASEMRLFVDTATTDDVLDWSYRLDNSTTSSATPGSTRGVAVVCQSDIVRSPSRTQTMAMDEDDNERSAAGDSTTGKSIRTDKVKWMKGYLQYALKSAAEHIHQQLFIKLVEAVIHNFSASEDKKDNHLIDGDGTQQMGDGTERKRKRPTGATGEPSLGLHEEEDESELSGSKKALQELLSTLAEASTKQEEALHQLAAIKQTVAATGNELVALFVNCVRSESETVATNVTAAPAVAREMSVDESELGLLDSAHTDEAAFEQLCERIQMRLSKVLDERYLTPWMEQVMRLSEECLTEVKENLRSFYGVSELREGDREVVQQQCAQMVVEVKKKLKDNAEAITHKKRIPSRTAANPILFSSIPATQKLYDDLALQVTETADKEKSKRQSTRTTRRRSKRPYTVEVVTSERSTASVLGSSVGELGVAAYEPLSIRCLFGPGARRKLVLQMSADVRDRLVKHSNGLNETFGISTKVQTRMLFPIYTLCSADKAAGFDSATSCLGDNFDGLDYLHLLLVLDGEQLRWAKQALQRAHDRLSNDRDKFRCGKVLVVLPAGRVRADYALDIGKHIVRHFHFTFNWRVGMTLKVVELQPIMLSVRQCSIARALYTVQLAMLQQFTFVKKKLAERLDTAIDEVFIWLATLPSPPTTAAAAAASEGKSSQGTDADDDDCDKHADATTSAMERPSGEELRTAMAVSRRLKDQLKASSVTEAELVQVLSFCSRCEQAETLAPALRQLQDIARPWLLFSMLSFYPSPFQLKNAIPMLPDVHDVVKGTRRACTLVLDHVSALEDSWFAPQSITQANKHLQAEPEQTQQKSHYFQHWRSEAVRAEGLFGETMRSKNHPVVMCASFGSLNRPLATEGKASAAPVRKRRKPGHGTRPRSA